MINHKTYTIEVNKRWYEGLWRVGGGGAGFAELPPRVPDCARAAHSAAVYHPVYHYPDKIFKNLFFTGVTLVNTTVLRFYYEMINHKTYTIEVNKRWYEASEDDYAALALSQRTDEELAKARRDFSLKLEDIIIPGTNPGLPDSVPAELFVGGGGGAGVPRDLPVGVPLPAQERRSRRHQEQTEAPRLLR
ncbi:hypothetical protein ACJJTC_012831 [Scirpophaga incertulas]